MTRGPSNVRVDWTEEQLKTLKQLVGEKMYLYGDYKDDKRAWGKVVWLKMC